MEDFEQFTLEDLVYMRIALKGAINSKIDEKDILEKVLKKERFDVLDFNFNDNKMNKLAENFVNDISINNINLNFLFYYTKLSFCLKLKPDVFDQYRAIYDFDMERRINQENNKFSTRSLKSLTISGAIDREGIFQELKKKGFALEKWDVYRC